MDLLVCWLEKENIAICGLNETNISAKEGKWCLGKDSKYATLWSNVSPDKKKGSGVKLLIRKDWENS